MQGSPASGRGEHTARGTDGLTVKVYPGDGMTLLAFDLDRDLTDHLAGFAVRCTTPEGRAGYLLNRLSFTTRYTQATTPNQRRFFPSNEAPFQKFRWIHVPSDMVPGEYIYQVTAMYFNGGQALRQGPIVAVPLPLDFFRLGSLEMGFTRGYLSSQAYAEKFKNAPITPLHRQLEFDTSRYEEQYRWLGFHARRMIFDFLQECIEDGEARLDVFAFDLDEPDFVADLQKLGPRLRIFLDDHEQGADKKTEQYAWKREARDRLVRSAGAGNVREGHFRRYAHNKVLIKKKGDKPLKVLTGSANFSVRGLYVQANNALVFDDPITAGLYEQAFTQAFENPGGFRASPIATRWFELAGPSLPRSYVSFAPHRSASISLDRVAEEIGGANSSVLYAVMELGGTGPVMEALRQVRSRQDIFSYGVTQSTAGLKLFKPGETAGLLIPFAYLRDKVPAPFRREWSGGKGQVIHHKFVVVDFNDSDPVVFTGSSNLAKGGEEANGDNLLAIYDRSVAQAYAVEAVRLVDHYHFRYALKSATRAKPLTLRGDDAPEKWWEPYYDERSMKYRDRLLFAS